MSLRLPDEDEGRSFDMSCVTAIEVFATGNNYDSDGSDFTRKCITLEGAATFEDVRNKMAGRFDLEIPESGLASIDIYGRTGDCTPTDDDEDPDDLLFFGANAYDGTSAEIIIKLTGNMSCAMSQVTVRPVDMMALVTTKDCAMAALADGPFAGAGLGTFAPHLSDDTCFSGATTGASLAGGVATFQSYTTVGPKTCLAVSAGNDTHGTVACVIDGPRACALPTEIEAPVIDNNLAFESLDMGLVNSFGGALFGVVWANAPAKGPVSGATVDLGDQFGQVVYVEPSGGKLVPTGAMATGPSGMFILYTDELVTVQVTDRGTGKSRSAKLTAVDYTASTAIVVMP